MSNIIASVYVTLDGVMESPEKWSLAYWNDEVQAYSHKQLFACEALLLGRVTYEAFAAAWPSMSDEEGFADRMNAMPKHVVSSTLTEPAWTNTTVHSGDLAEAVAAAKHAAGGDLLIYGSAQLVNGLARKGLVDEYRLWFSPVVRGEGKQLFEPGVAATLKLVETTSFATGTTVLSYQPERG